jgi:hypothetical protein
VLQAKFGTSKTPSPADTPQDIPDTNPTEVIPSPVDGSSPAEGDGFTQARGGRGRQRGDRGFRGGRGGEGGGFRGSHRGNFRGERGGARGGERGGESFFVAHESGSSPRSHFRLPRARFQ